MIGSLRGKLLRLDGQIALIEVNGVGYEVEIPVSSSNQMTEGNEVFVYIHHSVREDAQVLYGFVDYVSRALFRVLIKVNGVGPKMALAVLSTFEVPTFIEIVLDGKSHSLEQIPGVGKKTAERLVVELKDTLKKFNIDKAVSSQGTSAKALLNDSFDEAISALVGLGYRENDAVKYVKAVALEGMDTSAIIVAALAYVSSNKG